MIALVATIIIRNLDDQVAERLKIQARLKGVSLEQEARRILADGSVLTRREIAARATAIRSRQGPNRSRAVDLIRQDRTR
jgi:plasmid stability protein